jgi:hypothetical protein
MNPMDQGAFASGSKRGIESAALVGMITSPKDTPSNWISAGIALGRIANTLEQEGVSIAIHAGLAEFVGTRHFVNRLLGHTKESAFILFRAGYPKDALPPHSPRAPIDLFIV